MGLCVLLHALRVLEEVPANWSTKKRGGGVLHGNHGNQTRSLHKLCSFSFFDLVKAGVCINVPTFPYQRFSRPSSHVALLFISLLSFDWLPLQGQHQQRSLLRHAGHQEETHRKQEVKRDNLLNICLHLSLLPFMSTSVTSSVSPLDCLQVMCACLGDLTTEGTAELQKTQIYALISCIEQHLDNQPATSFLLSYPLPPPLMVITCF